MWACSCLGVHEEVNNNFGESVFSFHYVASWMELRLSGLVARPLPTTELLHLGNPMHTHILHCTIIKIKSSLKVLDSGYELAESVKWREGSSFYAMGGGRKINTLTEMCGHQHKCNENS